MGNKGTSLLCLGRHEDALKCFDEALKRDPDDGRLWFDKSVALQQLGRYDEAVQCFGTALRLDPKLVKYQGGEKEERRRKEKKRK